MTPRPKPPAPGTDPTAVTAARVLLTQMNITPADLLADQPPIPTFAQIVPAVRAVLTPGTLRTYGTHLTRLETCWGDRALDTITKAELDAMAATVRATARPNRATRGGRSAQEHFISATRRVYQYAEDNNWIAPTVNPARRLTLPPRQDSHRYALPTTQLTEIYATAATTGRDPALDALILRLHIETAARRGTGIDLRLSDLDPDQCLLHLYEKNNTDHWHPISPTLMRHLQRHAQQRGCPPEGQLLRTEKGTPITRRHYDGLWTRLGLHLPWVARQGITTHWLRHTTLTWVERNFGYAVARSYAGHRRPADATATYVKSTLQELAVAVSALTREPHPLLTGTTPALPRIGPNRNRLIGAPPPHRNKPAPSPL